jgi:Tfp pilus assembly protein PilO
MKSTNRVIVAMLAVAVGAAAFWMLELSPARQEADKLSNAASRLNGQVAADRREVQIGLEAKRQFPVDYGQLVVLGKAVPAEAETASLLVQLNRIAARSGVRFQEITLGNSGEAPTAATPPPAPPAGGEGSPVAPTESAASSLPLGATIGPAGLDVMPYSLKFTGDFSSVATFIHGLDALVKTTNANVAVNGRLVTIDAFSLGAAQGEKFPNLEANFSVTTYLTPAGQGLAEGGIGETSSPAGLTPAATTTGGTP